VEEKAFSPRRNVTRIYRTFLFPGAFLAASFSPSVSLIEASEEPKDETASREAGAEAALGIGFLWTRQSQGVAERLTRDNDFVDLILDRGKISVFDSVKPPVRVMCIALSLERHDARPFPGVKETIEALRREGIAPERVIIGYNPERSPGTPAAEMDDLVSSVRQAKQLAKAYGAPLLVGPGLRDMMQREHLYPELASHSDFWLIQSQRLQLDAATRTPVDPAEYRKRVKRIVELLREGNPEIGIFVQLVTTARRQTEVLTADQVVAFALAIEDLVDAVRIYGASTDLLQEIVTRLRTPAPEPAADEATPPCCERALSRQQERNP
jgi:hypothetical protein